MVTTKEALAKTSNLPTEAQSTAEKKRDKLLTPLRTSILNFVREAPITRQSLCVKFKKAMATMYSHLELLELAGLVKRVIIRGNKVGRPRKYWMGADYDELRVEPNSIDTKIKATLWDGREETTDQVATAVGIDIKHAWRYLNWLRKDGLIARIGKRSPFEVVRWKIIQRNGGDKNE